MRRASWWLVVGCISLVATSDALADGDSVRLVYALGEGAVACPSELTVRADVFALLGSDPFDEESDQTIECRVSLVEGTFEARLTMTNSDGVAVGSRTIRASSGDCADLGRAIGLTLAMVAKRPQDFFEEAEPPGDPTLEGPAVIPATSPDREPKNVISMVPSDRSTALAGFLLAGAAAAIDSEVRLGGSLYVGGGVRRRAASIELSLRLDTPQSAELAGSTSVSASSGALLVAPCYQVAQWSACALAVGGWVRGRGHNLAMSRSGLSPHFGVGARANWTPRLGRRVGLRVFLELETALSRTSLLVDDTPVWESPAAQFGLGAAAVADFL
jgi:hypothetical protein